jgi:hypothetical protein
MSSLGVRSGNYNSYRKDLEKEILNREGLHAWVEIKADFR